VEFFVEDFLPLPKDSRACSKCITFFHIFHGLKSKLIAALPLVPLVDDPIMALYVKGVLRLEVL
jgi:hypothetical protein